MKKIRIGNDFVFNWAIERGGMPEDLSSVLEKHLHLSVFGKRVELVEGVDYDITGNVIRIEVTPAIANITGTYKAEFHYILPDNGLIDEDRKCAVDVDAFQIVAKTAQADDSTEFSMTSDMAIAFKGDKGDSAYQVWLKDNPGKTKEDYFNWLQKPATDAVSLIDAKIDELDTAIQQESERVEAENIRIANEIGRVNAESQRVDNENERLANEINREQAENLRAVAEGGRTDAESIRVSNENARKSNETGRVSAEIDRVNAESIRTSNENTRLSNEVDRVNAESDRVVAEGLRQTNTAQAIADAEEATLNANTAAQNADDARLAVQDDLALKANHGYGEGEEPKTLKQVEDDTINTTEKPTAQSLSELNARITALEAILSNKIKDRIDVTKEFNVWGKTNLILYGDGASTKTPDFIGQTYIDTTNGNVYIAVGVSNAGNWKLV